MAFSLKSPYKLTPLFCNLQVPIRLRSGLIASIYKEVYPSNDSQNLLFDKLQLLFIPLIVLLLSEFKVLWGSVVIGIPTTMANDISAKISLAWHGRNLLMSTNLQSSVYSSIGTLFPPIGRTKRKKTCSQHTHFLGIWMLVSGWSVGSASTGSRHTPVNQ